MNLKDEYSTKFITELATQLKSIGTNFNHLSFSDSILNKDWKNKELKERMRWVTENLHSHLPFSYQKQIECLSKIAPKFKGLTAIIFPDFVQVYGLDDLSTSLKALELFTKHSTSEFAIRPFIIKHPKKTMQQLLVWSKNDNEHLRRLASEGTRPKLPWAPILSDFVNDPSPNLPILENLKNDTSLYVRKSVANHINDISKNQPKLVLDLTKKWHGKTKNTDWIVKHALRTLLKKGDKKALAIFGLDDSSNISIKQLKLSKNTINIGDFIYFEFETINASNTKRNLRIEYSIDYVKANGKTSAKVFQISEFTLAANSKKAFKRKQSFKELTTRKHYSGAHQINIIVNGDIKESIQLELNN